MKPILLIIGAFLCIKGCSSSTNEREVAKKEIMKDSSVSTENADRSGAQFFSCKLTTPELQKRKAEVIAVLKKQVLSKTELDNGFRYHFTATDDMLETIAAFIKSERACCGFFNFTMAVTNDDKILLDITGEKGVKDFIRTELEM